jgi:uncharacterized protein (TIGR03435 family)
MHHRIAILGVLAVSISIGLPGASQLRAQSPAGTAPPPSFDVASVKAVPFTPGDYRANLGSAVHGEVALTNATLSECLRFAFNVNNDDQISGPDWIKLKSVRFNIDAKAPPDTPVPQLRLMLQALLVERFKLVFHHEQRELPFLALVVGAKGLKIREAKDDSDPSGNRYIMGTIRSNRVPISTLAMLLSRFLRQPVLDMTGLKGMFELKLEWTPDNLQARPAAGGADPGAALESAPGPSIFEAVAEQLGMKLEPRKGALDVIVVDSAEKAPVEN